MKSLISTHVQNPIARLPHITKTLELAGPSQPTLEGELLLSPHSHVGGAEREGQGQDDRPDAPSRALRIPVLRQVGGRRGRDKTARGPRGPGDRRGRGHGDSRRRGRLEGNEEGPASGRAGEGGFR